MNEKIYVKESFVKNNILKSGELVLDIETTGFSKKSTIISITMAKYFNDEKILIKQIALLDKSWEKDFLIQFLEETLGYNTVITYNGDAFDISRLEYKFDFYNINIDLKHLRSKDVYKYLKNFGKYLGMTSLKLQDVEDFLGIRRDEEFDYDVLKNFYKSDENKKYIENILEHNYNDIINLMEIMFRINTVLSNHDTIYEGLKIYLFDIKSLKNNMTLCFNVEENLVEKTGYFYKDGSFLEIKDNNIELKILSDYDKKMDMHFFLDKNKAYPIIVENKIIYDNVYYILKNKLDSAKK